MPGKRIDPIIKSLQLSDMERGMQGVNPQKYFICETMITAGPRKKPMSESHADKDLGEDVCGFICDSNRILVWLLDGTSDLHCLRDPKTNKEYFSSRMLGLSIATELRQKFLQSADQHLPDIIPEIINRVKNEWLKNITRLPEQEHVFLKKNILNKNFPECAATIFVASIDIEGKLNAYKSGDSKAYIYTRDENNFVKFANSPLNETKAQSNDRIFFRLILNDDGSYNIVCNDILHETVDVVNVQHLVFFSDGINAESEQLLKHNFASDQQKTRLDLFHLSQQTGDDKSICFVEIRSKGI